MHGQTLVEYAADIPTQKFGSGFEICSKSNTEIRHKTKQH